MIKNYFLVAWRVFKKNKLYNLINITGLAIAIATCLVITLYIEHENSYDSSLKDARNIFSIYSRIKLGADTIEFPLMNYTTGSIITNSDPAVQSYVRIHHPYKDIIIQNPGLPNAKFSEENFLFADSNFFSFFSFPLLSGNPHYVLQKPFSAVITRNAAKKYFGNTDPVGKLLKYDSAFTFEITGVAENPPSNSIFKFDFVASLSSRLSMKGSDLLLTQHGIFYGDFQTFFLLKNPSYANHFESNIRKLSLEDQRDQGVKSIQYVIPLLSMHLHAKFGDTSKTKYLTVFPVVAALILLLALLNYVNLISAKAITRAKEVGIRKVMGANKTKIIKQFFIESAAYVTAAFIFGLVLFFATRSYFFDLLQFDIDNAYVFNAHVVVIFISILLFAIIFSAIFPAFIFSAYKPVTVLYKKLNTKTGNVSLRGFFIFFQFSIAIAVIICSMIINTQLYYIRHTDTGVNRANILMVPFTTTIHNNYSSLKEDTRHLAGVNNVATARYPLYQGYLTNTITDKKTGEQISLPCFTTDDQFIGLLGLGWKLPPPDISHFPVNSVVINEEAVDKLDLPSDPAGEQLEISGTAYQVKGVLKNFNFTSLTSEIDALSLIVQPDSVNAWGSKKDGCLYIKFYPRANIPTLITAVEDVYNKYDQSTPFSFTFLDDSYSALYKAEDRLAYIINIFTVITISIALLGLFGLASFSTEQKIKEIGIRKVLGATVQVIVYSLIKNFIKPVLLAAFIAIPAAWYCMHTWLQNFAYHTSISMWTFILSVGITILLTIVTTASLSIKAALMNPVKNLRTE